MGILKQRQNKKFSYEPRYYKSDKEGSPFRVERKFDQFRKTISPASGLKGKFVAAWEDFKSHSDQKTNRIILILVAFFILLFLFLIDFDLSIFTQPF